MNKVMKRIGLQVWGSSLVFHWQTSLAGTAAMAIFVAVVLAIAPQLSHATGTVTSATLNGGASVSVLPGASITALVNVTTTTAGGGNADRWRSTGWRIAATTGTLTCENTGNHNSAGSYSESFSITAPVTPGTYNAYFVSYSDNGCSSDASGTYTMTNAVTVVAPSPSVTSINRASSDPTAGAAAVSWTVVFDQSVTGVDAGDFTLVQAGGVTGAAITSVSGSGTTWTVTASTGSGVGTLGVNLVDNDSIVGGSVPLGGVGAGNGNFTGQVYTVTADFCTQPANTPVGLTLTCVCDTFGRASLNPSTIFGSNWIVSSSDSTGILPSIVNSGYLRLTNNTGNNAKAATVPGVFPAAGNYISVEFKHYAYNGSGADGIAVTLSDYAVPAVPGAFGGSLGYAQRTGVVGFAGGWIGVALDEYGNYQNPTEGRLGGPGFIVQSVGARGSGSGMTGYRWLGGTTALTPIVDNRTSTTPSPGYTYQVIVDARGEPTSTAVAVNRDTGSGYASLISIPNVYTAATANGFTQGPVPVNWQISFTGSTGGATNIHEIGGLRICAQTVAPPTGGTASGFNAIDEDYGNASGTPKPAIQNYLTGHIYMKLVGVPFKLNVAALNNNQIQTTYVVSGTKNVTVSLVDNSDNVCVLDSTQANYCSAACKAKTAVAGGSQTLSFAPANAGQKQSADFTLNTAWKKLAAIVSDGTTTACATDSFSVRPTAVTSVVSTTATNAATTGTPIFRAGNDAFNLMATVAGVGGNAGGYTGVLKIDNSLLTPVAPATVAGAVAPATFPAATSASGSSTANGATFTYSEVGAFTLPGYNLDSDKTLPRGVYDGVRTATECTSLGLTVAQCDSLKLAGSWTGIDSVSTALDCIADSYSNVKDTSATANKGKYGCNFGLATSTVGVGRFVPNEFRVSGVTLTNRQVAANAVGSLCPPPPAAPLPAAQPSSFTYLDEAMGLSFTLAAYAGGGNITRNYAGTLAKLALTPSPTSIASLAFGAANTAPATFAALSSRVSATGFTPLSPAPLPCTFGSNGWPDVPYAPPAAPAVAARCGSGVVDLSGTVTVSSLNTPANNRVSPDGPFTSVQIGIAPVDSDGVKLLAYDLDVDNSGGPTGPDHKSLNPVVLPVQTPPAPTTLYFGQMRFWPAHGSELQALAANAEVLRWNGSAFVPNGSDNCTVVPMAPVPRLGLRDYARNLNAGETGITSGALSFTAGKGRIVLAAPGAGNSGSVNVWGDLGNAGLGYLYGRWPALPGVSDITPTKYDNPPWATLTFGVYKGQWIDMRENFFY